MTGFAKPKATLGLRIDVDTLRGTRLGVPVLLDMLSKTGLKASFFFSVGPDNMGRHLWRLIKPGFAVKMLRSNAPSLYGWDIVLRGTFGPGPRIGSRCSSVIQRAVQEGHEVGLHAWDHYRWQTHSDHWSDVELRQDLERGVAELEAITGRPVTCSAAAGWKCTERALIEKEARRFRYNSDCRGKSIFLPVVDGRVLAPQIPVTMPTYDEVIGRHGVSNANYNLHQLARIIPGELNVLTIHAEAEGIRLRKMFAQFLTMTLASGISIRPLGDLLGDTDNLPRSDVLNARLPGREGSVCQQRCGVHR